MIKKLIIASFVPVIAAVFAVATVRAEESATPALTISECREMARLERSKAVSTARENLQAHTLIAREMRNSVIKDARGMEDITLRREAMRAARENFHDAIPSLRADFRKDRLAARGEFMIDRKACVGLAN